MGVGCDSLALVSIVPDCAAITQNVMTTRGRRVKIICAWSPPPRSGYTGAANLFWKRCPCLCAGVCPYVWMLKQVLQRATQ